MLLRCDNTISIDLLMSSRIVSRHVKIHSWQIRFGEIMWKIINLLQDFGVALGGSPEIILKRAILYEHEK